MLLILEFICRQVVLAQKMSVSVLWKISRSEIICNSLNMMLEELHFNTLIAIQSYEYYENIFLSKSY